MRRREFKGEGSFGWWQFARGFWFAAVLMSGANAVSADPASEALDRLVAAYPAALDRHDGERIFWRDGTVMPASDQPCSFRERPACVPQEEFCVSALPLPGVDALALSLQTIGPS